MMRFSALSQVTSAAVPLATACARRSSASIPSLLGTRFGFAVEALQKIPGERGALTMNRTGT
ncbi:MAG: hypothetical protein ABIQ16_14830 [Polyangiaceae bacterium]